MGTSTLAYGRGVCSHFIIAFLRMTINSNCRDKSVKYILSFQRIIIPLYLEELFDSIAPQNAENRTVSKSLPLFLKYSVKCLFFKRLYQTVENLK